jgi:hypothetical protein
MAEDEHPAAKAGRFFRAAGIAAARATAAARDANAKPAPQGEAVPVPPEPPAPPAPSEASDPKEHPAAKAGRYVRAAGVVIGNEVDRRTAAAAARPAPERVPPPPPPAAVRTDGVFATTAFRLFVVGLVILGITVLHFTDLVPSQGRTIVRLVLAAVMALDAFLLISNWQRANERVGQRLLTRMWGARGPMNRRERAFARALRDVLTLVGIGFLAAAVFQVLVAAHLGPG